MCRLLSTTAYFNTNQKLPRPMPSRIATHEHVLGAQLFIFGGEGEGCHLLADLWEVSHGLGERLPFMATCVSNALFWHQRPWHQRPAV